MPFRRTMSFFLAFALFLFTPSLAEAHVTVSPGESTTGAYEKYTVRVPVEKEMNTIAVTLEIPSGVNVVSVMPVPDWDYSLDRKDGRVASVTWTATEGGIGKNEFMEFSFVGANPDEPGEVAWKAIQTYEDGSEVRWVGEPDEKEPASITVIKQGEGNGHHHGDDEAQEIENKEKEQASDAVEKTDEAVTDGGTGWSLGLASLALLLSLIALFRKR